MYKAESQKIFLVRHAKPELPHDGRLYYGFTDYPLCEDGIENAKRLGEELKDVIFDHIFSSDMLRARQTAELVVPERLSETEFVSGLREINLGDWEGKSFDEVRATWGELYEKRGSLFDSVAPPNGESFRDLQRRTVPAFERILNKCTSGNILLFAHGGVIWTLICHFFDFKLSDMFYYPMDFCGLHLIDSSDGTMKLIKYNWSSKLLESKFRR